MQWFYDLKISRKLWGGFLIMALITSIIGFLGVKNLSSVSRNEKENSDELLQRIPQLTELAVDFQQVRIQMRNLILANSKEDITKFYDATQSLRIREAEVVKDYEKEISDPQIKDSFNEFVAAGKEYEQFGDQVVGYANESKKKEALAILWGGPYGQSVKRMQSAIDKLITAELKVAEQKAVGNEELSSTDILSMGIVVTVGIALAIMLGFFLTRFFTQLVYKITEDAEILAGGDLTLEITYRSKDEFGKMADSFRKMFSSLLTTITKVTEAYDGGCKCHCRDSSSTEQWQPELKNRQVRPQKWPVP